MTELNVTSWRRCYASITALLCVSTSCALSPCLCAEEPLSAHLVIHADQTLRAVPPLLFGHNMEWVWNGQGLFKKDGSVAAEGFVPLLQQIQPALIRYPGGSLANTFRFADSIGPVSERKPVANFFSVQGDWRNKPAQYKTETPSFGFDEFMRIVIESKASGALITVNCTEWPQNPELSGSAQEAAAWVAYANARVGDPSIPLGKDKRGVDWFDSQHWAKLRAKNGHPQPYGVRHWEIGNEVYDRGQGAGMSGTDYAARTIEFAKLMKSVDATIQIGAVIKEDIPAWYRPVVAAAKPPMIDFLVVHAYGPGAVGKELAMWSNGSKALKFQVTKRATYDLVVRASGQAARGIGPQMRLDCDGKPLGETIITAARNQRKNQDVKHSLELDAGEHSLTISFLNDEYLPPEDRNLFIEDMSLHSPDGSIQRVELMPVGDVLQEMSAQLEMFDSHLQRVRDLMKQNGVSLPFHVTEFNAFYGIEPELVRRSADLKSALYAARYLELFLETPDIEGANFWCIKSAWFLIVQNGPQGLRLAPAGLVYKAMTPLMHGNVLRTEWLEQPRFKTLLGKGTAPWVTVAAVRNENHLAVSIVNWNPTNPAHLQLDLQGARRKGEAQVLTLTGPHAGSMNDDGKPAVIVLRDDTVKLTPEGVCIVPPVSFTTIVLNLEK